MKRLKSVYGTKYPDAESLRMIRKAGGKSNLTPEQVAQIKMIRVPAGGFCDGLPSESRAWCLESGKVVEVEAGPPAKKKTTKKRGV